MLVIYVNMQFDAIEWASSVQPGPLPLWCRERTSQFRPGVAFYGKRFAFCTPMLQCGFSLPLAPPGRLDGVCHQQSCPGPKKATLVIVVVVFTSFSLPLKFGFKFLCLVYPKPIRSPHIEPAVLDGKVP